MIRRLALVAVVLAAAIAPAAADPAADIFGGFQAKSSDPIQVESAALETYEEGTQRVSVFSGGVTVKRGNTTMTAGTIKLFSPLQGGTADTFTRIEASGDIRVTSGPQTVTGNSAIVDMAANTIVVDGNVVLAQGPNVISGSKLTVDLSTGRAKVEQAPGKQIRGVFSPASN